jgi:hypothetical protein
MSTHGGSRPGSGRKPKADEEKIRFLAVSAIEKTHGSLEEGFTTLLKSGEASLIKFVWEHAVGKPRERMDLDLDNPYTGPAIIIQAPNGVSINLPDNTEEADTQPEDGSGDTTV